MMKKVKLLSGIAIFFLFLFINDFKSSAAVTQPLKPDTTYNVLGVHYTGAGVYQASGTKPVLTTKYTSASPTDPWRGGTFNINWSDKVRLGVGNGQLVTSPTYGFAFVAHVNLPESVTADQVLAAMNFNTANLTVGDTPFKLTSDNFEKIGDHTLRLTLRAWNSSGLLSGIYNLLTSGKFSLDNLYVNFNVDVDVAKMTAEGSSLDTSPNRILTKGMFPPLMDNHTPISVDFYGADQLVEGAKTFSFSPSGKLYANLNSDGSLKESNRATSTLTSWNTYISPWDNQGEFNTNSDSTETVDNNPDNLPGSVGNRVLTTKMALNNFQELNQENPHRFDRVVNFFTKKNVTEGATLSHAPSATNGLNVSTQVTYSGKDAQGNPLSPVILKVVDAHEDNAKVEITNMSNHFSPTGQFYGTVVPANQANFSVDASWTGPYLKTGEIRYRILNTSGVPIKGYEDQLFASIKNTTDYTASHEATMKLPALPVGQYFFDYKIVDDYDPEAAHWNYDTPETKGYTPVITAVNEPEIQASHSLTNLATNEQGNAITAYAGNQIQETTTYSVKNAGSNQLLNKKVTIGIPANVTYDPKSLQVTLNGKELTNMTSDQKDNTIVLSIPNELKQGDQLVIQDTYTIGSISNTTIATVPSKFEAEATLVSGNQTINVPITPVVLESQTITIPKEELTLDRVPTDFDFGETVEKPYVPVDIPLQNADLSFEVTDTRGSKNSWQLSATMNTPFQTAQGTTLPNTKLLFVEGKSKIPLTENTAAPIYTYTGKKKGDIKLQLPTDTKVLLHLEPAPNIQTNTTYSCKINWQLSDGPTQ